MLRYLHIENIAVIEQANIDFTEGFNVMTGETGAGKSIIIDALFAILGERTSRELIRRGCDRAVVSASFTDLGKAVLLKLEELGFSAPEQDELILQRTLFADGRGQVKINMKPATVSALREIGRLLINIHGQHDNQTLLDPEKHMAFIDAYAENTKEREMYSEAFRQFRDITRQLREITASEEEKRRRAELLRYQINEIEQADISPGEEQRLKDTIAFQQQSESVMEQLHAADTALMGEQEDDVLGALDLLRAAAGSLSNVSGVFPAAKEVYETLQSAVLDLEGVVSDLSGLSEQIDTDPAELENSLQRLDLLHDLMLKYGNTEQQILDYLSAAKEELSGIELDCKRQSELENQIEPAQQQLIEAGAALSASRKKAATEICRQISHELAFLDFNGAAFSAEIVQGKYTKTGCDTTEFLIAPNVGEALKPLVKIASGGELSRIMLAIRSVLSLRDDVGTLIFDEIDSGISGHAAQKVAVKLYGVSERRQVICVTHLAQIAAAADHHLLITKSVRDGKTYTKVEPLESGGRIREIARIMSGGEYTENLLKTAEEMIVNSKAKEKEQKK